MRHVANFEVISEISVVADDLVLSICDPRGAFKALIKNIPRSEYTTPFLLSVHIYFDAPSLETAREIAEGMLAQCLNMLAFTTGSGLRKHRIRQIVNAEKSQKGAMRNVLMWADKIEYDDPLPFLRDENVRSIERVMEHDIPPAISRALRWYRLGIDASSPDDQFTYFWFALEIVAEFQKSTAKINDKCPRCRSPLYCEKCGNYPKHRPYPKQAIRELAIASDERCDDATFELLDNTRNSLLHGATLREIECSLPDPHESVVDILGRILWKSLVRQFPKEIFDGTTEMAIPSTYVHYNANVVSKIETIVPVDENGNFDLEFKGMTVEFRPVGPPQSALPTAVKLTTAQHDQLRKLSYKSSDYQEMLQRVHHNVRQDKEGSIHLRVLATDMAFIRQALEKKEEGDWQNLFREIFEGMNIESNG